MSVTSVALRGKLFGEGNGEEEGVDTEGSLQREGGLAR